MWVLRTPPGDSNTSLKIGNHWITAIGFTNLGVHIYNHYRCFFINIKMDPQAITMTSVFGGEAQAKVKDVLIIARLGNP